MNIATSRQLAELAAGAARAVEDQVRDGFLQVGMVQTKRDFHDVVTEHDRNAEIGIRRYLQDAMPESRVYGEELGRDDGAELVWYVDPIDGTNNFATGIPFFCISIGAVWRGQLVAGVIYDPIRHEMFLSSLEGAFCNGQRLVSMRGITDGESTLETSFPTHRAWTYPPDERSDVDRFDEMVHSFRNVRRLGSAALTLAYVAAGRIDVGFNISTSPWDVAGGILLIQQAGGCYLPLPGTPEHQAKPWLAPGYLVHVGSFDLASSCMAPVARAGLPAAV